MSPLQDYKDTTTDIGDIYGMTDTDWDYVSQGAKWSKRKRTAIKRIAMKRIAIKRKGRNTEFWKLYGCTFIYAASKTFIDVHNFNISITNTNKEINYQRELSYKFINLHS
jgi:hypothetical protein